MLAFYENIGLTYYQETRKSFTALQNKRLCFQGLIFQFMYVVRKYMYSSLYVVTKNTHIPIRVCCEKIHVLQFVYVVGKHIYLICVCCRKIHVFQFVCVVGKDCTIKPAYKDHLCIRIIICWSLVWSLHTSFAVVQFVYVVGKLHAFQFVYAVGNTFKPSRYILQLKHNVFVMLT